MLYSFFLYTEGRSKYLLCRHLELVMNMMINLKLLSEVVILHKTLYRPTQQPYIFKRIFMDLFEIHVINMDGQS